MEREARCSGRGLSSLFLEALRQLDPARLVARRLERESAFARCVAIGKAAAAMASACPPAIPRLVLDAADSSHPFLDERSFRAGRRLLEFVPGPGRTLFLISGGASAVVEVCAPGVDPQDWCRRWADLYRQGLSIVEMNRIRSDHSAIKGGKLLDYLEGPSLTLVLSDVLQGPQWVGSGLTWSQSSAEHAFEVLADGLSLARQVAACLAREGWRPRLEEPLVGTLTEAVGRIQGWDPAPGEAVLASAEVRVEVRGSGQGGRCQELVLQMLPWLAQNHLTLLAAASDGGDGPTPAAGAWGEPGTLQRAQARGLDPADYLKRQDSYSFFQALGESWQPGATGNNLNDVVILLAG